MLAGNKTSISVEDKFWDGLRVIAQNENTPVATLIERIKNDPLGDNLSSSIRLFVRKVDISARCIDCFAL